MTDQLPPCPQCGSEYSYEQGALLVCPMCAHEWSANESTGDVAAGAGDAVIKDAVGNELANGDAVSLVKSLKVKGAGGAVIKAGTKVRGIRLLDEPVDGHDIEAKIPGMGQMFLKSSIVKKA